MAEKSIKTRLQLKHDTASNWHIASEADSPFIPKEGEPIFYTDSRALKIGNNQNTPDELSSLTTYSNNTPVVSAIGGVTVGTTFEDMLITDVLTKILYPYVAPIIGTTSSTPNGGTFENGSIQTVTAVTSSVTKKSASITKIELLQGDTVIATHSNLPNGGNIKFTELSINIDKNTVTKKLTVKVTDSENKSYTKNTGTFNFVYPYYCGVASVNDAITEEFIKGLTKKVEAKNNKTIAFTAANQKTVFAYPKAYGMLSSIKDQNGFNITGGYDCSECTITGLDGTAQVYYVYTAANASTINNFNITFSY